MVTKREPTGLTRGERRGAVRDTVLLLAGLGGYMHELLSGQPYERPYMLALCGVMMGFGKLLEVAYKLVELVLSWVGAPGAD